MAEILSFPETLRISCFLKDNNKFKCQITEKDRQEWLDDIRELDFFGRKEIHTLRGISSKPTEIFIMFEKPIDCFKSVDDIICSTRKEIIGD